MKNVLKWMKHKSKQSLCTYRVVAVGFSRKGNVIGIRMSMPQKNRNNALGHAEYQLMTRYGRKLNKIVIARFNGSGKQLPIEPCKNCSGLAERLGITIERIEV